MNDSVLDNIQNQFLNATQNWYSNIFPYAQRVFFILVAIELTWAATWWMMERDDPTSLIASLLRKIIALTFFYAILLNAGSWIPAVLNSFMNIGAQASGLYVLSPSGVLSQGIDVAAKIFEPLAATSIFTHFVASLIAGLSAVGIMLAFAVIAGQLLITVVESYIVMGGGILLLGFAGSRWTASFAERYLSYAVSVGVKLFVLYLVIGVGNSLAQQWGALLADPAATLNARIYFDVLGGALAYMLLAWYIPSVAAGLLTGSVSLSLGEAAGTAAAFGFAAGRALNTAVAGSGSVSRATMEAARFGSAASTSTGSTLRGVAAAATALGAAAAGSSVGNLTGNQRSAADRLADRRAAGGQPPPGGAPPTQPVSPPPPNLVT